MIGVNDYDADGNDEQEGNRRIDGLEYVRQERSCH